MLVPRPLLLQTFARRYGLGCVCSDSRWNLRGDAASRGRACGENRGKLQTREPMLFQLAVASCTSSTISIHTSFSLKSNESISRHLSLGSSRLSKDRRARGKYVYVRRERVLASLRAVKRMSRLLIASCGVLIFVEPNFSFRVLPSNSSSHSLELIFYGFYFYWYFMSLSFFLKNLPKDKKRNLHGLFFSNTIKLVVNDLSMTS